jgi:antiviral helicase SKI2
MSTKSKEKLDDFQAKT